jgi:hypothetical protein
LGVVRRRQVDEGRRYVPCVVVLACEFCGKPLVDPIEEAFNLAFIAHLRGEARCMELFSYGMTALRNELGVRLGKKPAIEGI